VRSGFQPAPPPLIDHRAEALCFVRSGFQPAGGRSPDWLRNPRAVSPRPCVKLPLGCRSMRRHHVEVFEKLLANR
jgi:hypothetical protein